MFQVMFPTPNRPHRSMRAGSGHLFCKFETQSSTHLFLVDPMVNQAIDLVPSELFVFLWDTKENM